MRLTPTERDRLLLFTAAQLARGRQARGLRLNVPEAIAIIADTVCEAARDGLCLDEAVARGQRALSSNDVLPGVADIVTEVKVEAAFEDGTHLAVVVDPVAGPRLNDEAPGAVIPSAAAPSAPIADNHISVTNTGAVPITVSSHYHFFETNKRLLFDRAAAYGQRLAIPAGATIRFDPGVATTVGLTPIGGGRVVIGFAGLVDGPLDAPGAEGAAIHCARDAGYLDAGALMREPADE